MESSGSNDTLNEKVGERLSKIDIIRNLAKSDVKTVASDEDGIAYAVFDMNDGDAVATRVHKLMFRLTQLGEIGPMSDGWLELYQSTEANRRALHTSYHGAVDAVNRHLVGLLRSAELAGLIIELRRRDNQD